MDLSLLAVIMLIGLLGIGSQWVSWKFNMPAIVVMSIVGLIVGPFLNIMNPKEAFGDLYDPVISIAVAIILFEGALNLNVKELTDLGKPVIRISTIGAFIAWILGSLTAHYMAGLSWEVAFVIGGLFIVTGPTVIMPLLRQSKLKPRPAKILKWEGIIVDPLGVLVAVFAFEIISFFTSNETTILGLSLFFVGSIFAIILGGASGRTLGWAFEAGYVPEFLKSPVVFVVVIAAFALSDEIVHGTGLLTVVAMGITLANIGINSVNDFRHFKENISVLLISAIFVMIASSLQMETILHIFTPSIIGYVLVMMFFVRPISILIATIGSGLTWQEKALPSWIAPRGIVALTVSGYFASILLDAGYEDAKILTTLTFGLVFFTVVVHGFTLSPLAKRLHLSLEGKPGVLMVGSNKFTVELANILIKQGHPVLIVDNSWYNLRIARNSGIPFYHGEILSEQSEYNLDTIPYDFIIAASHHYSYNALVCTAFMPEYGRTNVFKVDPSIETPNIIPNVGGRSLAKGQVPLDELVLRIEQGQKFGETTLTEKFSYDHFIDEKNEEAIFLYFLKPSGQIHFYANDMRTLPQVGDKIISLSPPKKVQNK